jgi:hypothetical protein
MDGALRGVVCWLALMDFISVETRPVGVTTSGQAIELLDPLLGVVAN